jgi:protein phosphatase
MGLPNVNDTAEFEMPPLESPGQIAPPLAVRVEVDFGALSHPGKVRTNNEDHFLILRLGRVLDALLSNLPQAETPTRFEEYGYVLAVADGMGGQAGGEIASRVALRSNIEFLLGEVKWNLRVGEHEARDIIRNMNQFVRSVDITLTEQARFDKSLSGMGTTLTAAYTVGPELFGVHVGDSRLYLYRGGTLTQLTRDHTVAQSLADAGEIAPEQVATHRQRHVLTSAIGGNAGQVQTDVLRAQLQDDDRLLLCTDGLSDRVSDARMAQVLRDIPDSQPACDKLLEAALDEGGRDNITVIVAHYKIPQNVMNPSPHPAQ